MCTQGDPINMADSDGNRPIVSDDEGNLVLGYNSTEGHYHSSSTSVYSRTPSRTTKTTRKTSSKKKDTRLSDALNTVAKGEDIHKTAVTAIATAAKCNTVECRAVSGYAYGFTTPWSIASHMTDPYLTSSQKWTLSAAEVGIAVFGIIVIAAVPGIGGIALSIAYAYATYKGMDIWPKHDEEDNGK